MQICRAQTDESSTRPSCCAVSGLRSSALDWSLVLVCFRRPKRTGRLVLPQARERDPARDGSRLSTVFYQEDCKYMFAASIRSESCNGEVLLEN